MVLARAVGRALAIASFAALIPVLFDRGPAVPGFAVIHTLSGVSFAACGLIAWRRRPDSAVGRLLTAAGFIVLVAPILSQIDSPLAFTLVPFGEVWIIAFATLILSFVTSGRLVSTVDRVLVGAYFVGLFVLQFAELLFFEHPDNLLLVWPDAEIASALDQVRMVVLIVASVAVVFVIGERWRSASAPRRRALLPAVGGTLCAALYAAWGTSLLVESPVVPLVWILNAALLTVPAALLWGLLRSRLARSGLADLFRELGTLRGVRLEAGLAKALGDPGLVLAYRVPGEHSYIDGRGRPVELPLRPVSSAWPRPSSETAASSRCSSTTHRSTTIRSSWRPSRPRLRSRSTTRASRRSLRTGSPSCAPRASASSLPATPSAGGSSATSTTGRRRGSCRWRSSSA